MIFGKLPISNPSFPFWGPHYHNSVNIFVYSLIFSADRRGDSPRLRYNLNPRQKSGSKQKY
jgi:hypothetical protein